MTPNIENFMFRDLHPRVSMGTASDRYAGWLGQIYTPDRFAAKISKRSKTVGGQTVTEELLPVESVEEYFQHFSVLELDFTFYSLLLDEHSNPTPTLRVLETYRKHLKDSDRIILKVPQAVFAQKLWRGGKFAENPGYLNAETFVQKFYKPAADLLGPCLQGLIFEQEYQAKKERTPPDVFVSALDRFFAQIPKDDRYHVEVRTEAPSHARLFRGPRKARHRTGALTLDVAAPASQAVVKSLRPVLECREAGGHPVDDAHRHAL